MLIPSGRIFLALNIVFTLAACGSHTSDSKSSAQLKAAKGSVEINNHGFYDVDEANVPASVRQAADSVVMIVAPAGQPTTVAAIFGQRDIHDIIASVDNKPVSTELSQGDKDLYLYQLRSCAKTKTPLTCTMYAEDSQSTAYIVGDGHVIRTAFHAVRDWAQQVKSQGMASHGHTFVPALLFVYDRSGKLISSPENETPMAEFATSNLSEINNLGGFTKPNDDLVEIRFTASIGRPLKSAATRPTVGKRVYIAGYPMPTTDRKANGGEDSPGQQLRISTGQIISTETFARKEGLRIAELTQDTKTSLADMTISDADGAPGDSGGPLLNERGEVVGTFTASNPADGSFSANHVSYGSTH